MVSMMWSSHVLSCVVVVVMQKTAYEMRISDWISDVCSSDLFQQGRLGLPLLADAVDQLQSQGLLGQVGAGLDVAAQGRRVKLAVGGGLAEPGLVDRAQPREFRLAMRGRVVVIEVAVDRVLIFVALLVVGLDAVLVDESL